MFVANIILIFVCFSSTICLFGSLFYACTYLNVISLLLCYFIINARYAWLNGLFFFGVCNLFYFNYFLIHALLILYVSYVKAYYVNFWTLALLFIHVYFYILTNYFQIIFLLEFYALLLILAILVVLMSTRQNSYRLYLYSLLLYYFYSFLFSVAYISALLWSKFTLFEFQVIGNTGSYYLLLHFCLIGKLGFYLFFFWKQRVLLFFTDALQYLYILYYYIPLCIWYGYFLTSYFFYFERLHWLIYLNLFLCIGTYYWLTALSRYILLFVYSGALNFALFFSTIVLIL